MVSCSLPMNRFIGDSKTNRPHVLTFELTVRAMFLFLQTKFGRWMAALSVWKKSSCGKKWWLAQKPSFSKNELTSVVHVWGNPGIIYLSSDSKWKTVLNFAPNPLMDFSPSQSGKTKEGGKIHFDTKARKIINTRLNDDNLLTREMD